MSIFFKLSSRAEAPGRVNIIGEHIDYAGYSVFPCALMQGIRVSMEVMMDDSKAVSKLMRGEGGIRLEFVVDNANEERYPNHRIVNVFDRIRELREHPNCHRNWTDYIICGFVACMEYNGINVDISRVIPSDDVDGRARVNIFVEGNVPCNAGLSSSSALVVASALSFIHLLNKCAATIMMAADIPSSSIPSSEKTISMLKVAESCCHSERLIGTLGGGMDQAISCLAILNHALHVSFSPQLHVLPVQLPGNVVFILANSLKQAQKGLQQEAKVAFNTRVIETKVGAKLLAAYIIHTHRHQQDLRQDFRDNGVDVGIDIEGNMTRDQQCRDDLLLLEKVSRMKDVEDLYRSLFNWTSSITLSDISDIDVLSRLSLLVEQCMTERMEDGFTLAEVNDKINHYLGTHSTDYDIVRLLNTSPAAMEVITSTTTLRLKLYQRSFHVINEASRVLRFVDVCLSYKEQEQQHQELKLNMLGQLMNESHDSLRSFYDCSCIELDSLVQCAIECGAFGARLTGAGWGGMVVSLVREEIATRFIADLTQRYYVEYRGLTIQELPSDTIFATRPGAGARVL